LRLPTFARNLSAMLGKNALTVLIALVCVITGVLLGQRLRVEWSDSPKASAAEKCIDPAGREYRTVKIGDQIWMAENLAYKPPTGNYWAYDNDPKNVEKYGYLYDWETAKNVCPEGWHLPSDDEWTTLTNYLGGVLAGHKMKSKTGRGTDESGFSGLLGGNRSTSGTFNNIGYYGFWWSSSEYDASLAWTRDLNYDYGVAYRDNNNKSNGFSVRCLMD
jgi:uncharacterized protein (TIGR02145 family)